MLLHFQYYIDTDIIIFISFSFALFAISFSWVWRRVAQRYVVIDFSVRFPITCQSGIHQVKPHDYFPPILAYLSGFFFFFFLHLFSFYPYSLLHHFAFLFSCNFHIDFSPKCRVFLDISLPSQFQILYDSLHVYFFYFSLSLCSDSLKIFIPSRSSFLSSRFYTSNFLFSLSICPMCTMTRNM